MSHHATGNLVSVIMVSFFTGPVLDRAIAAVLASEDPVELVIVNNGNPPAVEAALEARAAADPRIKLVTGHGNVGFSKACNKGAMASSGNYFLFLNPDCLLKPDTIHRLLDHAGNLKPPFMIGARLLDEAGKDQQGSRRALLSPRTAFIEVFNLYKYFPEERLNLHQEPLPTELAPMPAISGAFMFLSRQDFVQVHGFDEGYFLHVEDLDFCLRFRRAKGEIYFAPDIFLTHVGGTSHTTSVFLERQKAKGFVRYFHENFGHAYPQPVLWALYAGIWARFLVKVAKPFLHELAIKHHVLKKG